MTKHDEKPFALIDGSSYLYRAFHALPPLTTTHGEPTGAMYGVINMIRKLINDYDPQYCVVVFDPKGKTTRDYVYAEYKAHRPPMPDDLQKQIKPLHDIIKAMGLPLIMIDGVEADDVIASIAKQARQEKMRVIISTGDKDMAQIVDENITLVNTMNNSILDQKGVVEKFGVPPERIIDYLALVGDTADNVPGVPSVGPKTAVKWLAEYGTLDNIIKNADNISGKVGESLRNNLSILPLSKQLVTLDSDVSLNMLLEDLKRKPMDEQKLIELFKQFEFKSWLNELLEKHSGDEKKQYQYQTILSEDEFESWMDKLKQAEIFAFDTETTSLDTLSAQIVGISFSIIEEQAAYVPLAHDYLGAPSQLSREKVLNAMKLLLENPHKKIIGQNLKYDINVLANYDIRVCATIYDTLLESYILNSSSSRHDMDTIALKYLGRRTTHFEDIAGKGAKQKTFNQIHLDQAAPYAAQDADVTLQLHHVLWPKIVKDDDLRCVLTDIEFPLVHVLAQMERNGVMIDADLLHQQSKELAKKIQQIEESVYKLAGCVFNLASPKQLQEILYVKLKLPILSKTPKGAPSTAEEVLQELAFTYELPKMILQYRSLTKLKSTYADALPKQINIITGRVHTSYNQAITSTGRLSSTEPNLQNIPIRTQEGRRIRKAFIAPSGYRIISADYSQVELRIMAHLSQDKGLLAAFEKGADIHRATAAEVFGIAIDQVTSDQRRHAKAINFGLIYGMSSFGLSKQLSIERNLAQKYMDLYFSRYPGVKFYMETIREIAKKQGYVETLLGRRLYVPEIHATNLQRKRAAERAAINAPMQGTAADIIKIAMIELHAWLQKKEIDAKMIMQVHDELVFEVAKNDIDHATSHIEKAMTHAVKLAVPLVVNINVGDNWDEAH